LSAKSGTRPVQRGGNGTEIQGSLRESSKKNTHSGRTMQQSSHLAWDAQPLEWAAGAPLDNIPAEIRAIRYPFRLLRYWFMHHLLAAEARRRGLPLAVGEIGVDRGQMLSFSRHACARGEEGPLWYRWDAIDCVPVARHLLGLGYTDAVQADIEHPHALLGLEPRRYDCVILLHLLEHLRDPEAAVRRIARLVKPGGIVIGGGPGAPEFIRRVREARLRRKARPFGHVSALSAPRMSALAEQLGWTTEFMSGGFFLRKRGFRLENAAWWLRFNLWFGSRFPSWPGEIYWSWRVPGGGPAVPEPATVHLLPRPLAAETSLSGWCNGTDR
jgi:SAM-dependent methyltransferase